MSTKFHVDRWRWFQIEHVSTSVPQWHFETLLRVNSWQARPPNFMLLSQTGFSGLNFRAQLKKIISASSLSLTDPWQCPTWPWHGRLAPKWLTFFVFSGLTSWLAESCLYCKCASKWPVCVSPSGGDHHAPTLLTTGNKGPIEWSWQSRQRGSLMANLHAFVQGNWSQLQGNRWNSLRYPHSGFPLTFFFGVFYHNFFSLPTRNSLASPPCEHTKTWQVLLCAHSFRKKVLNTGFGFDFCRH